METRTGLFFRFCLTAAANWYQKAKNPDKANEILVKVAESFVAEAEFRQLSAFIAANYYSDAIHQYEKIPRKYRVQFDVENRVLQLKKSYARNRATRNRASWLNTN